MSAYKVTIYTNYSQAVIHKSDCIKASNSLDIDFFFVDWSTLSIKNEKDSKELSMIACNYCRPNLLNGTGGRKF